MTDFAAVFVLLQRGRFLFYLFIGGGVQEDLQRKEGWVNVGTPSPPPTATQHFGSQVLMFLDSSPS